MRLAAAGDAAAFRILYDRSADRVHRTARWLLGSSDVEDVVQDVFIRAWQQLPSLRQPEAFDGWLHRLAVNVILRSRAQWRHRADREPAGNSASSAAAPQSPPGLRLDLERAVGVLPPRARHVFLLYDVEGYSHEEIGSMLGISHHTSRSQLHRARSLLRGLLGERA